jgi:signal transduction histidine kinase
MNRKLAFLAGFFLLIIIQTSCHFSETAPVAQNGVLDLRAWDFNREGNISLTGAWEFYSEKLLTPDSVLPKGVMLKVPGNWNDLNKTKSFWNQGNSYGTYHLKILVKPQQDSLAIWFLTTSTAHKSWINRKMVSVGTVGTDEKTSVPKFNTFYTSFSQQKDTLDLLIQVSNFHYRKGGLWKKFVLGTTANIHNIWLSSLMQDIFLIGAFSLIGLYYLISYFIIRFDYAPLFFSMFCLLISLRILSVEEYNILLFANLPWEWVVRCEFLSYYLCIPVMSFFSYNLFPLEVSRKITYWVLWISLSVCVMVVVLPVKWFNYTVVPFHLFSVSVMCYGTICYYKAWKNRRGGSAFFLAGFIVLFIVVVNDILFNNNDINTGDYVYMGVFLFVLSLAITLSRRFSLAFVQLGATNQELNDINLKLLKSNAEVSEKNEQLKKLNEELDSFVYRTSHDLRAPISSLLGLFHIARFDIENTQQLESYFEMGEKSLKRMDQLISDIINYSQNSRSETQIEEIDFKSLLEEIFSNFNFMGKAGSIAQKFDISQKVPFGSDSKRIYFILNNLLSNAIKYHDTKKSHPFIKVKIIVSSRYAQIEVEDNGQGIKPELIDKIFQMFYRATEESQGSGLGLYIVKETVEKLNGTVDVNSVLGEGTTFKVMLPNLFKIAHYSSSKLII